MMAWLVLAAAACVTVSPQAAPPPVAQHGQQADAKSITPEALHDAIDHLGAFDDEARLHAAQIVRRAPGPMAVVALLEAAATHVDGYVRYRALVLLSGYKDPRVRDEMERALKDPNDRLRAVAYRFFERHPEPSLLPDGLAALDKETAEFVRPALLRALAAQGTDPRVRQALLKDVMRGQDFFRSTVIEALGDYKAAYASRAIMDLARLDGPLQDDAALALGRIGDKAALSVLADLQRTAPRENQPLIAAGICLLGVNCDTHRSYLTKTLVFADKTVGYQELLRGAATGLGALAEAGDRLSFDALIDTGIPARDPVRAPCALALAAVAMKNPAATLAALSERTDRAAAVTLVRDGFDMLEEDFDEEGFFVAVRKAYWSAPEGSPTRQVADELIQALEF